MLEIRSDSSGLLVPYVYLDKDVEGNIIAPAMNAALGAGNYPADGLIICYDGSNTDHPDILRGLWYYSAGTENRWAIFSRSGSIFSLDIDNFAEMYEANVYQGGTNYNIVNTSWTPWISSTKGVLGPKFDYVADPIKGDYLECIGGVADVASYYTIDISTTLSSISSSVVVTGQAFLNDNPVVSVFFRHKFQTGGEYANCSTTGLIMIKQGDKVRLKFQSTTASENISVEQVNLRLTKIGSSAPSP
ncbi:MAG: hypothetical protein HQ565_09260 [Bacteroidetes bacterium]|nr:hypothetical protein [Bacteroidota bacterium]